MSLADLLAKVDVPLFCTSGHVFWETSDLGWVQVSFCWKTHVDKGIWGNGYAEKGI